MAVRPTINAPDNAFYEKAFQVTASSDVTEFSFLRMSSATHSINNEQRRIPVSSELIDGYHQLDMPNANVMPPGYYMLFGLNADGVPSISKAVLVGPSSDKIKEANLLVEYDFFEGNGNFVKDLSGKNNHGAIIEHDDNGNPVPLTRAYWSANGLSGNALEMDGREHQSNSLLEIPTNAALKALTNKITVMAWVNRNADVNPPNASIFAHDYPSFFLGYHGSQYKLEFYNENNNITSIYTVERRSTPEVWEHVVGTYDGSTARIYVNGEEIVSERKSSSGNLKINRGTSNYSSFNLAGFYEKRTGSALPSGSFASGITDELDGRMDKFKLYNAALTAQEIKAIYDKEVDVVFVEGPCDAMALEYEINGKRDGRRKEITMREGDTLGLFLDVQGIDYSVFDTSNNELPSHIIQNISESGVYTLKYDLKKYS